MSNKKHEPVIEVEEVGSIPENEMPAGAKVIEMPAQQQPQGKTVKQTLIEDVNFLRGMSFTTDEVEKFGLIIAKVKQDLIGCILGIEAEEKRLAALKEEKNADTDAE